MRYPALKPIALFIFIAIFSITARGQLVEKYIPGYVEFQSGEKAEGFIRDDEIGKMNYRILFKTGKDQETPVTYDTSTVKKVVLTNGAVYDFFYLKPLYREDSIAVLGKLRLKGHASLYEVYNSEDHFFIVVKEGVTYALQEDKVDELQVQMKQFHYKAYLSKALDYDSSSAVQIESLSFNDGKIIKVLSAYNAGTGSRENTLFSEKSPKNSFIIVDIGGMYANNDKNEAYIHAIYRTYYPQISRSTSLNVGIHYYSLHDYFWMLSYFNWTYSQIKIRQRYNLLTFPLQIQQNLLNKSIRPYVFAGANLSFEKIRSDDRKVEEEKGLQKNFGFHYLYGAGIEGEFAKNWRLKSEYRFENFTHMIMVGVGYIIFRR